MNIWQAVSGEKYLTSINDKFQRMVESQSYISTRKLVDSLEEQEILEAEIEKSKPPFPDKNARGKLDFLLFTPFRYPPLLEGGRFHNPTQQSIFYGSREQETTMAEIAYKRFVFRACSAASIKAQNIGYTKFSAKIQTNKAVDLTAPPFNQYRDIISNPASHAESQILGTEMRKAGIEAFLFFSARIANGINCGVMSVEAFGSNKIGDKQEWNIYDSENTVEFMRKLPTKHHEVKVFHKDSFLINGKLPLFS